jgi:hypothetical protein
MRRLVLLVLLAGVAVFVARAVAPDIKRYKQMSDM